MWLGVLTALRSVGAWCNRQGSVAIFSGGRRRLVLGLERGALVRVGSQGGGWAVWIQLSEPYETIERGCWRRLGGMGTCVGSQKPVSSSMHTALPGMFAEPGRGQHAKCCTHHERMSLTVAMFRRSTNDSRASLWRTTRQARHTWMKSQRAVCRIKGTPGTNSRTGGRNAQHGRLRFCPLDPLVKVAHLRYGAEWLENARPWPTR